MLDHHQIVMSLLEQKKDLERIDRQFGKVNGKCVKELLDEINRKIEFHKSLLDRDL